MLKYSMPVEFYFGKKAVEEHGYKIKSLGNKALIVTGKNSAKLSGALDDIIKVLNSNNISYEIFDKINQNPEIETIYAGVDIFKNGKFDMLIGIGGGSPIDSAKAISVIAKNNIAGRDFYNPKNIKSAYPIVAIPTTSGTGSEVTPFSVISDKSISVKSGFASPFIFPKFSFLDPTYTISLSQKSTRDTAIDALSHLLEGIYSIRRNKINYPLIFKGVKLIIDNLKTALEHPNNIEARENLQMASLYGGMVIAQTGTTLQHSIGYPLTTEFGLTHGLANGIVMKLMMEKFYPAVSTIINEMFDYLNMTKESFYNWLDSLDMQFDYELTDNFYEKYLEKLVNSKNHLINPIKIDKNEVKEIYQAISKE